ncbi:MAG: type secretion-associated protein family [Rhizobacter sp.]|nr:type secretion-associated protein family [Rhizobacter sp.]
MSSPTPSPSPTSAATVPGWYGKLPTLGDFASRRLAPAFVEAWDGWLATGIAGLRESQGEPWLDAYLASPIWRFVLMPGSLDEAGSAGATGPVRAGVLMPSVDRVGRYFPLTLLAPIDTPSSSGDLEALLGWLHRLDDAAADALHEDWAVDTLEAELARLAPPSFATDATAEPLDARRALSLASFSPGARAELAQAMAHGAAGLWAQQAQGLSFWLAEAADAPPRLLTCRGLPRGDRFAELFGPGTSRPADAAPFSLAD